ncbi:MAG: SH3 domain-containing protein [Pseudomonadota bacterium]
MRRAALALFSIAALVGITDLAGTAQAAEFRSVQDNAAILYDAPSTQATKRFVVGVGHPLEVLVKLDRWIKVRDNNSDVSWIEAKSLSAKRTLIVALANAEIRDKASTDGAVVFRADKGLLLELVEGPAVDGWAKVRHRDGQSGYISNKQVWGL